MQKKANGEIKIDKGIPIPFHNRTSGLMSTLRALDVGDSFFCKVRPTGAAIAYAFRPKKFITRSVEGGFRVWRVE